jgi:hypothetical protein
MAWINQYTIVVGIVFIVHIALMIVYNVRKGRKDKAQVSGYQGTIAG